MMMYDGYFMVFLQGVRSTIHLKLNVLHGIRMQQNHSEPMDLGMVHLREKFNPDHPEASELFQIRSSYLSVHSFEIFPFRLQLLLIVFVPPFRMKSASLTSDASFTPVP